MGKVSDCWLKHGGRAINGRFICNIDMGAPGCRGYLDSLNFCNLAGWMSRRPMPRGGREVNDVDGGAITGAVLLVLISPHHLSREVLA
jgi:hypothetical protein